MQRWMKSAPIFVIGCVLALPGMKAMAQAQGKLAAAAPVTYDNRWEAYGGLLFANGQAGQNLPKRYNMGGAEIQATYWLTGKWGATADGRWSAGTTPVFPNAIGNIGVPGTPIRRPVVYQTLGMGGVTYRGPKNHYAGIDFHALVGVDHGQFNKGTGGTDPALVGMYENSSTPTGVVGASVDFNGGKNWAIRLSPDLTFEHFGSETREFVSVSLGYMYRFGKRK